MAECVSATELGARGVKVRAHPNRKFDLDEHPTGVHGHVSLLRDAHLKTPG